MDDDTIDGAPKNPRFGTGVFRRRIRLRREGASVAAELEDSSHAFKSRLTVADDRVTQVDAEAIRYPMTTCPGALEPLQKFVGTPLGLPAAELASRLQPRSHCTHLFDLSVLAYCHFQRSEPEVVFDIEMPDELDAPVWLEVRRDGATVLRWQIRQWQISAPAELAGRPLHSGFSRWLADEFGDDQTLLELAWLAQKGYLVAQARIYDINALGGTRRFVGGDVLGICHTYSEDNIGDAVHTFNSFKDFSEVPEQLLRFEP